MRDRIVGQHLQPGWAGVEIGPGSHPTQLPAGVQCAYVDKRDAAALSDLHGARVDYMVHPLDAVPTLFPSGADFLIAHNVLEHSHDPIGTLIGWNGWLRDGGIGILSLPDKSYCPPDAKRLSPDFFHLLSDFLFARGEDAFESLEHIPGFLAGWQAYIHPDRTRAEYCDHCLAETQRGNHDLHWHALDRAACYAILAAASAFGERRIELVTVCSPTEGEVRTTGEIIFVYRVRDRSSPIDRDMQSSLDRLAERELAEALETYRKAVSAIEAVLRDLRPRA